MMIINNHLIDIYYPIHHNLKLNGITIKKVKHHLLILQILLLKSNLIIISLIPYYILAKVKKIIIIK
jgi:hypothetical protein